MNANSIPRRNNDETRDPVEALADEFVQRLRGGELPSIDDYVQRYPQWSADIRELFPTIASMERLKISKERVRNDGRASLGAAAPQRLGDFRVIREIGRGGMGVVYEAEQESLQRRVAVKVLPRHSLDTEARVARFQQEARTAARLHHSNIVPVFGVGEHDGFHYYVMQLIRGVGLDEVLASCSEYGSASADIWARRETVTVGLDKTDAPHKELSAEKAASDSPSQESPPLTPRVVARLAIQAAEALQYAHEQGVLHRDVKPGNLVLDSRGVLFVTDFGLAKVMDQADSSAPERLVGTLRFMAPEQFQGAADARTDIYSLGMTVYELLLRRPAFSGSDRTEVMRRIQHGELTPPRKIDPRLPLDLEAVILKASACDPANRYQSAAAMADDLKRWLEDLPVDARYVSPVERFWRWSRRNPAIAGLSSMVAALLMMVIATTSWAYLRTRRELLGETSQRVRTEQRAKLSFDTLDQMRESFAPRRWSGDVAADQQLVFSRGRTMPPLAKETATVLEDLLRFYEKLAGQSDEPHSDPRKAAEARYHTGQIQQQLGHLDLAITAYEKAIEQFRLIAPRDPSINLNVARIYNDLGWTQRLLEMNTAANRAHETARDTLVHALHDRPGKPDPELRFELAHTHYLLARSLRIGEGPVALNDVARAPTYRAEPHDWDRPPSGPDRPPPRGPEGRGRGGRGPEGRGPEHRGPEHRGPDDFGPAGPDRLGGLPPPPPPKKKGGGDGPPGFNAPPLPVANNDLRAAIEILEMLRHDEPHVGKYRHLLAICYRNASTIAGAPGQQEEMELRRRAINHLQDLIHDHPQTPEYRYDLAETLASWDVSRVREDDIPQAIDSLRKAATLGEPLVAEHPNVPDYAISLTHIFTKLADAYVRLAERQGSPKTAPALPDAELCFMRALQLQAGLMQQFPEAISYRFWQAKLSRRLAEVKRSRGEYADAKKLLQDAIQSLQSLTTEEQTPQVVQTELALAYRTLGDTLAESGDKEGAAAARRQGEGREK